MTHRPCCVSRERSSASTGMHRTCQTMFAPPTGRICCAPRPSRYERPHPVSPTSPPNPWVAYILVS
eukprot:7439999-Pyramimonas_sp.AAC.1